MSEPEESVVTGGYWLGVVVQGVIIRVPLAIGFASFVAATTGGLVFRYQAY